MRMAQFIKSKNLLENIFNLVGDRADFGDAENLVNLLAVEVRDSDGPGESQSDALLHFGPSGSKVDVAVGHCAVGVSGHELFASLESHRPVHQVQVQVFQAQGRQSALAGGNNSVCVVVGVPQLKYLG